MLRETNRHTVVADRLFEEAEIGVDLDSFSTINPGGTLGDDDTLANNSHSGLKVGVAFGTSSINISEEDSC